MKSERILKKYDLVVIGGGAAGMAAAITAAERGINVCLVERQAVLGKKLAITGGGRCNICNENFTTDFFAKDQKNFFIEVFNKFGKKEILNFFDKLGLKIIVESDGRMFPRTNQAASVVKVLQRAVHKNKVDLLLNKTVSSIKKNGEFKIKINDGEILANAVVLACGGKSYPALGSNGSGYDLAKSLGHKIIDPVPSGVPLVVKSSFVHFLQGQKVYARVTAFYNKEKISSASGDLLFTNYGLSGTAIIDMSQAVSILLNRHRVSAIDLEIDLFPELTENELEIEIYKRLSFGINPQDVFVGLLPNAFERVFSEVCKNKTAPQIVKEIKTVRLQVAATRGWNEAEFTCGGVELTEVNPGTMQSKKVNGLYLAGEILNIQAARGGYHLGFCWSSGVITALALAEIID